MTTSPHPVHDDMAVPKAAQHSKIMTEGITAAHVKMKIQPTQTRQPIAPSPTSPAHHETIYSNGSAHFHALENDIVLAKTSIAIETFIFNKDPLGDRIVKILAEAARRGVQVRILVDGAGSPFWTTNYAKKLERSGAKTRVFHPFPWQLWNWSRSFIKLPWMLKLVYLLLNINARNHRKVCIIDDTIAYVGSANISQCHLKKEDGGANWRDTSIRVAHTDLSDLINAFDAAWSHRSIKERIREIFQHLRQEPIIRVNHSRHRRRALYKHLLRRITRCKRRIWITNAYFIPDTKLLRRLKEAAQQGIDVRILLPEKSDVTMMPWASSTFYHSLLKAGVRIFEYLPSILHAKSLIIDDWASLGSTNLNSRSLLHDLEADVIVTRTASKKTLERLFLQDLQQSREIPMNACYRLRPLRQRLLGRIILYLKYWI